MFILYALAASLAFMTFAILSPSFDSTLSDPDAPSTLFDRSAAVANNAGRSMMRYHILARRVVEADITIRGTVSEGLFDLGTANLPDGMDLETVVIERNNGLDIFTRPTDLPADLEGQVLLGGLIRANDEALGAGRIEGGAFVFTRPFLTFPDGTPAAPPAGVSRSNAIEPDEVPAPAGFAEGDIVQFARISLPG